jgi:hypothetical protein
MADPQRSLEIVAENAAEFRIYVAQYWSPRRNQRIREYADAVPEADLLLMSPADRDKVMRHARMNLGLAALDVKTPFRPIRTSACAPSACTACSTPCQQG